MFNAPLCLFSRVFLNFSTCLFSCLPLPFSTHARQFFVFFGFCFIFFGLLVFGLVFLMKLTTKIESGEDFHINNLTLLFAHAQTTSCFYRIV